MDIIFYIEYYTATGEQMALHIAEAHRPNSPQHILMTTDDNALWQGVWHVPAQAPDTIDYYFSVEGAHGTQRREWTTVCHRLDLPTRPQPAVRVYGRWIDVPHDTYRYSSAFTECLHPHALQPLRSPGDRCARLVCRAPQLRSGQRLVLTGADRALGEWHPEQGLPMAEHNYCEWVAEIPIDLLTQTTIEFKFAIIHDGADPSPIWEDGMNRTLTLADEPGLQVYELDQSFYPLCDERVAGTLVPVFSLRTDGSFGVGDFGDLMAMTDLVASTGQRMLQVLPINDTTVTHTWTDSYPYSCISVFALHPQYADLRQLPPLDSSDRRQHYAQLQRELNALPLIDYERMMQAKESYLHELYQQEGRKAMATDDFARFFDDNGLWLVPYAQYCYLRDTYRTTDFAQWQGHATWNEADRPALSDARSPQYHQVAYYYYVQYVLHSQMTAAHDHARRRGVVLKGDIPIGVHRQGCDVWMEPRYFCLDGQAGAPPDDFAVDGQNWGFPTYNWDAMLADGCQWWNRRFTHMALYFDAYRIDHILGFFRIWEIPIQAVRGLLGQFAPALALSPDDMAVYGLHFDRAMTRPYITDSVVCAVAGPEAAYLRQHCLSAQADGTYALCPEVDSERKVQALVDAHRLSEAQGRALCDLLTEVLFLEDHRHAGLYHPRISAQRTHAYRHLSEDGQRAFDRLYDDFYYHRNNGYWYGEAMKKLPPLIEATRMLACAEDLGMVPACVAPVMEQLRVLSLEIQTMPKTACRFADLQHNPYRSVCTISSHDMAPLRQWWDEDKGRAQDYYSSMLHHDDPAPHPMPGWLAEDIVERHLMSPSMLCILSLQDWLSIDELLRLPNAMGERINIPADPHHYWRYRMHVSIEQIAAHRDYRQRIADMIEQAGRR